MQFFLQDGGVVDCDDQAIGSGTSGDVFLSRDRQHAVKVFKKPSQEIEQTIRQIVTMRSIALPDKHWERIFCWPDCLVVGQEAQPSSVLGVRMPAIPSDFVPLTKLVLSKSLAQLPESHQSWDRRIAIARRLAASVDWLHKRGLAHSDLSFNNVYANPLDGRPYLIDLDSLVVTGHIPPRVLGTPEYIAPEILCHNRQPSAVTDLHSLSVLIHQLLLYRHPLRGPKVYNMDARTDELEALGENAVYISHPRDSSNTPRCLEKGYWPAALLGGDIAELFVSAFVDGLRNPASRPTAKQWEEALVRVHDRIIGCTGKTCPQRYFTVCSPRVPPSQVHCPWCHTPLAGDVRLLTVWLYAPDPRASSRRLDLKNDSGASSRHYDLEKNWWVLAYNGRFLYRWHLNTGAMPTHDSDHDPVAVFQSNGADWFLHVLKDDTGIREVSSDKTLKPPLAAGATIELHHRSRLLFGHEHEGRAALIEIYQ